MPILPGGGSGGTSSPAKTTTTVQNIADEVARDAARALSPDHPLLLDWVNRIHLEILRTSRWKFLESSRQYFTTRKGQTEYFIGSTTAPAGTFDTGLALTDVDYIRKDSVIDRSNWRPLQETRDYPPNIQLSFQDERGVQDRPKQWRYSNMDNPYVLSIYPPPDNQNIYQPIPQTSTCITTAGGALAGRVYYVNVTLVDSRGQESTPASQETRLWIPASSLVTVRTPEPILHVADSGVTYTKYNVYAGTTSGAETLQASNISIGTDWTEPTSGLVAGTAFPTVNNIEPMGGYLIEFVYFKVRSQLISTNQVLQVPDDYKDVMIHGTSWLAAEFLKSPTEAQVWYATYQKGLSQIIRDANLFSGSRQFIKPDQAAQSTGYFNYGR